MKTVAQERLDRIRQASAAVHEAERRLAESKEDLEDAKDIVKGRKAEVVRAQSDLDVEINDGDPTRPLQNVMEGRARVETPKPNGDATTIADESWRSVVLSSMLADKDVLLFIAADIHTVGDLADYTAGTKFNKYLAPNPHGRKLIDIEGVGPATAERIEQRMEKFWADRKAAGGISHPKGTT